MAVVSAHDIPMIVRSSATNSERRVTPSWTISQFKAKLESITGIPPSSQGLTLRVPGAETVVIAAVNEDTTQVGNWHLQPFAEIYVADHRPSGVVDVNFSDTSAVTRYTMSDETYESLPSTVLAWKKVNKLGRFDPGTPDAERDKIQKMWDEVAAKHIEVGKRCQLGHDSDRRGKVAYIGEVEGISTCSGPWIGVVLDEPTGKNDGSLHGKVYFRCSENQGSFVRPDRVLMGDFPTLEHKLDDDLEEI